MLPKSRLFCLRFPTGPAKEENQGMGMMSITQFWANGTKKQTRCFARVRRDLPAALVRRGEQLVGEVHGNVAVLRVAVAGSVRLSAVFLEV